MYYPTDFISVKMAAIILGQSETSGKRRIADARIILGKGPYEKMTIKEFCGALKRNLEDDMKRLNEFAAGNKR